MLVLRRSTFFVLALCLFSSLSLAQNLRFSSLSTEQGLSTRYCWSALQDRYGYLWIGTQFGLNRWDGVTMKRYQQSGDTTQLPSSNIYNLCEAHDGTLWLACLQGGLARYNRATETFSRFRPDSKNPNADANTVVRIVEARDGRLWLRVSERGAVYVFDPKTSQFKRYAVSSGATAFNTVLCFFEDKKGTMWLGTERGLFRAEESSSSLALVSMQQGSASAGTDAAVSMNEDSQGRLLVGSAGQGLWVMSGSGSFQHYAQLSATPDAGQDIVVSLLRSSKGVLYALCEDATGKGTALATLNESALGGGGNIATRVALAQSPGCTPDLDSRLCESPNGELWVNGMNGALLINPTNGSSRLYSHTSDDPESIAGGAVRRIFFDRSGAIWFVTRNDGVSACFPPYKRMSTLTNQGIVSTDRRLLAPTVSRFVEDHNGNLWIGYYMAGGISVYNRRSGTVEHIMQSEQGGGLPTTAAGALSVFDFMCDNDGSIWIASSAGLLKMNPATKSFQVYRHNESEPNSLSSNNVESVYRDRKGNLWVGTRSGLNLMDANGNFQHYNRNEGDEYSLSSNDIRVIYEDRDGMLWFGGDGLTSYEPSSKAWRRFKVDAKDTNALLDGFIAGLLDAEPGALWVNDARGGLCRLDKSSGKFSRVYKKLGLPTNTAGLVRDAKGVLWMNGESSGVWTYNPSNNEVHNYGKGFGLPTMDAVDRGIYQTKDGELWVGTTKGIAHFYPDSLERNPYKPPVVVSALRHRNETLYFDQALADMKSVELRHDQNDVVFEFTALSFLHAEDNRYKYRLEGYDQDWTDCGSQREAKYTNLPPGTYHFHVIACNNDNVWNEEGASLELIVLPPWWATWWARTLFVLAFFGITTVAYRWRVRSIHLRNAVLERQVQERTKELSAANEEVRVQNINVQKKAADLEQALHELQQTQAELVQSEKMAALGQLVAGIAHEVNTPLGAIKAAIGNIRHASDEVLKQLPQLIKSMNDAELSQFLALVQDSVKSQNTPTGREARNARRAMTESLSDQGIGIADHIAEMMVEMGLTQFDPSLLSLWQRPDARLVIDCAYNLSLQARQSSTIEVAVERASKVVFALKTYAHYDHRNEKQSVNVPTTMEVVMTLYHNTLKHGIELQRDYDENVPDIQAYGDELTQVWTNLVHNAIQAMGGKGNMSLSIKTLKADKRVQSGDRMIEVGVGDTGGGIPEEIRDRIFNPFFTTKPAGEGSGLGLDICKKIIEKHGGTITFRTELNKGTTFLVYLPV